MTLDTLVIINLNPSVLISVPVQCNLLCLLNCFCLVMSPNTPLGTPVRTPISHTVVYEAVSKPRNLNLSFRSLEIKLFNDRTLWQLIVQ